jgi:hypothetical protein
MTKRTNHVPNGPELLSAHDPERMLRHFAALGGTARS